MRPTWNAFSVYWLAWFVVGFLGPEIFALCTNSANTLSDQVWHLDGVWQNHWTFARFMVVSLCVWLTLHFSLGWFR